jgi:CheY-like chemotaxis protein
MKKILIIEDDPVAAQVYKSYLRKEGFEVFVVIDGESGWDRILELRPDGVLLDLMLPKVNGIELLKRIRALESFQKLPVMAYTNGFVPQMVEEARAAGATKIFDKSTLTAPVLLTALRGALEADP